MQEELKLITKPVFLSKQYKTSPWIGSDETVDWIPIIVCWEPDKNMGISKDGYWVVEESTGVRILNSPRSFLRVKILLERPLKDIREEVTTFFSAFNIDVNIDDVFPFAEIIQAVLEEDTNYWIEVALQRYDELPIKKKLQLRNSLEKIKTAKGASQKMRHKAMKEIAKLNRE